jgi:hypothetical protein
MIAAGRVALLATPASASTSKYTELEWSLKTQSPAVNTDVYEFRVFAGSTPLNSYAVTPQLTISVAVSTYDETGRSVTIAATVNSTSVQYIGILTQEGFRWRNDDGSETTATGLAAQDTNASLVLATAARLRVLVDTAGSQAPTKYKLYYKKTTDSVWAPVPVGSGGGSPVYVATSSNITASGQDTTALLAAPSGKTTADFLTGRMWDDENGVDAVDLTGVPSFAPFVLADITGPGMGTPSVTAGVLSTSNGGYGRLIFLPATRTAHNCLFEVEVDRSEIDGESWWALLVNTDSSANGGIKTMIHWGSHNTSDASGVSAGLSSDWMYASGTMARIASDPSGWTNSGVHTVGLRVVGSQVTVVLDGIDVFQVTDSAFATMTAGGYVGVGGDTGGATRSWNTWRLTEL